MNLTTTRGAGTARLKLLVYGQSGSGKTTLCGTTGDDGATLILSAEAGLLPLRNRDIAVVEITSLGVLRDVYATLRKGEHPFKWVMLDSLTEIAERVLREEKKAQQAQPKPNLLRAYGDTAERIDNFVRLLRDLPCHVVALCQRDRVQDADGRLVYGPALPGKKLAQVLPYHYDIVCALRVDDHGERYLMTQPGDSWEAKDRSGALSRVEPADLAALAAKIAGETE